MCTAAVSNSFNWSSDDRDVGVIRLRHVLLADDDDDFRALAEAAFRRRGYLVSSVRDGYEFVEFVASATVEGYDMPDVVVTDVQMPGLNGLQLLRVLRDCGWPQPVILISGFADENMRNQAGDDAFAFIEKPCSMESVGRAVDLAARTPID